MYGIYANIWGILMVNVTIYIAYMDPMGTFIEDGSGFRGSFQSIPVISSLFSHRLAEASMRRPPAAFSQSAAKSRGTEEQQCLYGKSARRVCVENRYY